jgi:ribosome-binding factor A
MAWDKFDKLIELVKRRISSIVLYKLKDPRIGFVTITKIDLSRDLKECKVFYTVYGTPGEISRTAHAMNDARGFIQREIAKTLRTRVIPKLVFIPDESIEGVERVERLLDDLKRERLEPGPPMEGLDDGEGDGEE